MKKLYRIIVLVALSMMFCDLFAQNFHYDFEQCNVGDQVAATLGEPWTTWSQTPGSVQDAIITDEHAIGTKALKIDNGNDLVLKLGDKTSGTYNISFDMYIPEEKEGYFNVLHQFSGSSSVWAFQSWFNSENYGNRFDSGVYDPFEVPLDEWFNVDIVIYLDDTLASMKIDGQLIWVGVYSRSTTAKAYGISAMDFFPSNTNHPEKNGFYIDNVSFTELQGPFLHNLVPEMETINMVMLPNTQDTLDSYVTNEGNGLSQISDIRIDYGLGQEGGEEQMLSYGSMVGASFGNYNYNPYIEVGALFHNDFLLNSGLIGTRVTKMQIFLWEESIDGFEGPMTFRVYDGIDGVLLAEKTLNEFVGTNWNVVEFDEPIPLTGHTLFATVGFQQANNGYPIVLFQGPSNMYEGDLVRLDGDYWFSLNDNYISYGGEDLGDICLGLVCEGLPIEHLWVKKNIVDDDMTLLGNYLTPGKTRNFQLAFTTSTMDYGEYEAVMRFETENPAMPETAIPIRLKVSGTNVNEFAESKYQIYPNPASDFIRIEGENANFAVIYNAMGEMLGIMKIVNSTIDVKDLETGVYFICIIDNSGERNIQKMVISR